jgi:hypothetical protein
MKTKRAELVQSTKPKEEWKALYEAQKNEFKARTSVEPIAIVPGINTINTSY